MNYFKKMILFSNWKIYMRSRAEVINYVQKLKAELGSYNTSVLGVFIMLDSMSFEVVNNNLKDIPIYIGVQDIFWEDYGSYVGEVAPLMLKDIGCKYVYIDTRTERCILGRQMRAPIKKC